MSEDTETDQCIHYGCTEDAIVNEVCGLHSGRPPCRRDGLRTDGGKSDRENCPECGTGGELYAPGKWGCPVCENTWDEGEGM